MVNNSKGGLVDIARHSQLLFYSMPSAVMEANNCKILESTLFTIELFIWEIITMSYLKVIIFVDHDVNIQRLTQIFCDPKSK